MNQRGSIRSRKLLAFLPVIAALAYVGIALSQTADPCAIYGKTSVNIPVGTPTTALVAGVSGQAIYVCGIHIAQLGATPGLTLAYGEAVAATPCATATPGGNIGVYGGAGTTNVLGAAGGSLFIVPASTSTPLPGLCGLVTAGNGIVGGSLDYVQVKP